MNIHSVKRDAFSEEDSNLLGIVSQQIEVAINNAKQAEQLQKAKEGAEAANRAKSEFLARTFHYQWIPNVVMLALRFLFYPSSHTKDTNVVQLAEHFMKIS